MSWFDSEGKRPLHVIYTQTNYKRNLAKQSFINKCDSKILNGTAEKIDTLLLKNGFRKEELNFGDKIQLRALGEKGYVDADFLLSSPLRALYFNEPCSLAISVGGKDLLTVRSILPGLAVTETRNIASGAEELLDREIEFAYSDTAGYLSPNPMRCGSGAELSTLLYLPSLRINGSLEALRYKLSSLGATLFPFLASENDSDLYFLSYYPSHLCNESTSTNIFNALTEAIIKDEIAAERIIFSESSKIIVDKAWRAYGTLLTARSFSAPELLSLCSSLRFALATAEEKKDELPPLGANVLNTIIGKGLDCSVICECGICKTQSECDEQRAKLISSLISTAQESRK